MGKGNCNVKTEYGESIYYIDNDFIQYYYKKDDPYLTPILGKYIAPEDRNLFEYDQDTSQIEFEAVIDLLKEQLMHRFKSLSPCDKWIGRHKHAILENKCFYIALEDNEWSIAIELLIKDDANIHLQRKNAINFGKGIRDILLKNFDVIHIRTSTWTSERLTKEKAKQMDTETKEAAKQLLEKQTADSDTSNKSKNPDNKTA